MDTPIFDFVKEYSAKDISRLHMPGHKGKNFVGCESADITEIAGADILYDACGIIERSENNASAIFDTAHTFYSVEGSSLSIKAMLAIALMNRGDKASAPTILAARNVHKTFIDGCALLGVDVNWMYPKENGSLCSCKITADMLTEELTDNKNKPFAVYVTSPDYLGNMLDIRSLAAVCENYKIPLLVDNAHGAYLNFLQPSLHPIALGAAICCDSAHKTLPVLTGGAYLHVSKAAPPAYVESARRCLSIFASTSPSYIILQSLDICNKYLDDGYRQKLNDCIVRVNALKKNLSDAGWRVCDTEPLKLVLDTAYSGYNGVEIHNILRSNKIECEFADDCNIVMMFTPENGETDYNRIKSAFCNINLNASCVAYHEEITTQAQRIMSIRDAIFADHEIVDVDASIGRVCGAPTVSCPPAVPIAVSGEIIREEDISLFHKYGIDRIEVVKE